MVCDIISTEVIVTQYMRDNTFFTNASLNDCVRFFYDFVHPHEFSIIFVCVDKCDIIDMIHTIYISIYPQYNINSYISRISYMKMSSNFFVYDYNHFV